MNRSFSFFLFAFFAPVLLSAQVCIWTGQASDQWHEPTNWSNGQVPTANQDVYVAPYADFAPTVSLAGMNCNKLVMPVGAQLTVSLGASLFADTFLIEGALFVSGLLDVSLLENYGVINVLHTGLFRSGHSFRNSGHLNNDGQVRCDGSFANYWRLRNRSLLTLRGDYTDQSPNGMNDCEDYGHIRFQSQGPVQRTSHGRNKYNYITIEDIAGRAVYDNPMVVCGGLTLVRGVLNTQFPVVLPDSATLSGGSELSYIDGAIVRASNAQDTLRFPVGANGHYRPLEMIRRDAQPAEFSARAYGEGFRNLNLSGNALDSVSSQEYWELSGNAPVNLRLFPNLGSGFNFTLDAPRLVLAQFNLAAAWDYLGQSSIDINLQYLQLDNIVPNGIYTFGFSVPPPNLNENEQALQVELYQAPEGGYTVANIYMKEPTILTIELYDIMGRLVYTGELAAISSNIRVPVPTEALPVGNYVLRVRSSAEQVTHLLSK